MTAPSIKESGTKTKSRALELIVGSMEGSSRENGLIIICMVWEYTLGQMADVIWVSTKMIRSMAMVSTNGQMVAYIWVSGCVVSNMALEYTRQLTRTTLRQQ
tara:strand:+ start:254 stop:559 length:306 start_codon:yes stop_codon:yes gene_type:complete